MELEKQRMRRQVKAVDGEQDKEKKTPRETDSKRQREGEENRHPYRERWGGKEERKMRKTDRYICMTVTTF